MATPQSTNAPGTAAASRQPRLKMTVAGQTVPGCLALSVHNNVFFAADAFQADLSISALPPELAAAYWSGTQSIAVAFFVGFKNTGSSGITFENLIEGMVDEVEIDLVRQIIHIAGRDLSSVFLETKTAEKFPNRTSSDIVGALAARHGFETQLTKTATPVGRYYEIEHARLNREQSEWDLLTFLAQEEGFDLFVRGRTLFFAPPASESATPYVLAYRPVGQGPGQAPLAHATAIRMRRNLLLARDVRVTVRSWHQQHEASFAVTGTATSANCNSGGVAQNYSYTVANRDHAGAMKFAKARLNDITRFERMIEIEMPGELPSVLDPRIPIRLQGTATGFDQIYLPDSVERRLSFEGGFQMSVRAKNHSPQSVSIA